MNIGVAIQAATRQRNVAAAVGAAGIDKCRYTAAMAGRLMTLLTQHRRPQLEKVGDIRAMRVMA